MTMLTLIRNQVCSERTMGVIEDAPRKIYTLELPYRNNHPFTSCIPPGVYGVVPHYSSSKGKCFKVLGVPHRSEVLIHVGNTVDDTEGCILVGFTLAPSAVFQSKKALEYLLDTYPNGFTLSIF